MDIVAASHFGKILQVIEKDPEEAGLIFQIYKYDGKWEAVLGGDYDSELSATGETYMEAIANLDTLVRKD